MKKAMIILFVLGFFTTIKSLANPGDSCISAIALPSGAFNSDYSFQSFSDTIWFSFVADSRRMTIGLTSPVLTTDLPLAQITSLSLYSGNCNGLKSVQSITKSQGFNNDSLPEIQLLNWNIGQRYYLRVTKKMSKAKNSFFGLEKQLLTPSLIPSPCNLPSCGPELVINGGFETPPSWAAPTTYQDNSPTFPAIAVGPPQNTYNIMSPDVRYGNGSFVGGYGCSSYDFTDIYNIGTSMCLCSLYNNVPHSGNWFMGIDCPSRQCMECNRVCNGGPLATPGNTCTAWQQSITVIPGETYEFSAWIECMDVTAYPGATVNINVNAVTYFSDIIVNGPYSNWVNVSFCWTAPNIGNTANIQITGTGANNPNGYDFSLDDISFKATGPSVTIGGALCTIPATATANVTGGLPPYNYAWSNGQFTSTVSGLTAGTYSVLVTDASGCQGTAAVTISPSPTVVITATNSTVCPGENTTLSASVTGGTPSFTYNWSTGSPANNITVSPSNTTTYSVSVTDANGCLCTASITINIDPNCCPPSNSGVLIAGPIDTRSLPIAYRTQLQIPGASNISSISGILTVDNNYTISGTNIAMGNGAQIIVSTGNTLTITNDVIGPNTYISRLYACTNMWQGITVEPGATLIIENKSIIEDAQKAIEMNASGITISNQPNVIVNTSTLNNNFYDIVIDPAITDDGPYHLTLQSSTLTTSVDAGFSNNAYLKPPYAPGIITNSGVYLNGMGGAYPVTIGDYSLAGYKNTFSIMNYGVNAVNSGFNVYNNEFDDLEGYGSCALCMLCPPPPCVTNPIGIAVLANANTQPWTDGNTNAGNPYYQVNVGGTIPLQGNSMNNCYRGVDMTDYAYPTIVDNNMNNANDVGSPPFYMSKFGDHGVYLKQPVVPQVTDNVITNFNTGIHLWGFSFTGGIPYYSIPNTNISTNTLNTSGNKGVMNIGIFIEAGPVGTCNLCTIFPHPLYVQYNKVFNAGYACFEMNNAFGYPFSAFASIDQNTLQIFPSTKHTDISDRAGVLLNNDQGNITVSNNSIYSPNSISLSSPTAHPYSEPNTHVIGIRAILSIGISYECNSMDHVGQCMRFEGYCVPSYVYKNDMRYSYDGLVLWNNGQIGTQGGPGNPIGDSWFGIFLDAATYAFNSDASQSPLYVLSTTPNDPLNGPLLNLNSPPSYSYPYDITDVTTTTGTPPACPPTICIPCQSPAIGQQQLMQSIVQNKIPYDIYVPETQYINNLAVFGQLNQDTALLNGNPVLQAFYTKTPFTGMGNIYAIGDSLQNDNVKSALVKNSILVPSNGIEQNYKDLYNIQIQTLGMHVDSADSAQYSALVMVAQQCPLEGGGAVFQARATINRLLNTTVIFPDSCDNEETTKHRHSYATEGGYNPTGNNSVRVYPNPANSLLNIETQLVKGEVEQICLYNTLGQEIRCVEITNNITILPISTLPEGLYCYRITDQAGNLIKTDKVIIIH